MKKQTEWRRTSKTKMFQTVEEFNASRNRETPVGPILIIHNQQEMDEWVKKVVTTYFKTGDALARRIIEINSMQQETVDLACIALHQRFGFGEERLKQFINEFSGIHEHMRQLAAEELEIEGSVSEEERKRAPHYWKVIDGALKDAMKGEFKPHEERYAWTGNPLNIFSRRVDDDGTDQVSESR